MSSRNQREAPWNVQFHTWPDQSSQTSQENMKKNSWPKMPMSNPIINRLKHENYLLKIWHPVTNVKLKSARCFKHENYHFIHQSNLNQQGGQNHEINHVLFQPRNEHHKVTQYSVANQVTKLPGLPWAVSPLLIHRVLRLLGTTHASRSKSPSCSSESRANQQTSADESLKR